MTNADLLHRFLHRVWIEGDMDAVDEIFAEDTGADGLLPDMILAPDDFKVLVQALLGMVTDPQFTIVKTLSDAEWVTVMTRIKATSQIGSLPLSATSQITARFKDGKIVETYNHFDFLGLFQQMGLIPQDAISLCLSGESLN